MRRPTPPAFVSRPAHSSRRRHVASPGMVPPVPLPPDDDRVGEATRFVALLAPVAVGISVALCATLEVWALSW